MRIDDELISLARDGDDKAMDELVERYLTFAKDKAKSFIPCPLEYDDIVQEAMIGFLSAFCTYDVNGSASFKTYAGVCMSNRVISVINAQNREKRIPAVPPVSIDFVTAEASDISCNPEAIFLLREQADAVIQKIESDLSDYERKICYLHLRGYSYEEISEKTSCGVKSIDNAIQRIRKKLRDCI